MKLQGPEGAEQGLDGGMGDLPVVPKEPFFLSWAGIGSICLTQAAIGGLLGEGYLVGLAVLLAPVLLRLRRAVRRRGLRLSVLPAGEEDPLRPWDEREVGSGFVHDAVALLPDAILVGAFGWALSTSLLTDSAVLVAASAMGLLTAAATAVVTVNECGQRIHLWVRGVRQVRGIEALQRIAKAQVPSPPSLPPSDGDHP